MQPAVKDTIFSKIIRREIPAQVVYETDTVLAFRDINPQAPTHILVIPKKPIAMLGEAAREDREVLGELLFAAAEIARSEGIAADGYRVVINNGENGGQEVPHLHLHLIGGRRMSWPPG